MLRFVACGGRPAFRLQPRTAVGVFRLYHSEVHGGLRRLFPVRHARRTSVLPPCQVLLPDVKSLRGFSTSPLRQEDGQLVYTGNLGRAVLGVKFFSYSTSLLSVVLLPYILMKSGLGVESFPLKVAFCSVVGFFTFVTPVTLHFITKGYVVRLYHNSDRDLFTAVTYGPLLTEKRTVFSPEDVEVPDVSKMFTTFYAKKKSMLVNPDLFPNPWDYHHLMGYDKPFTFNPEDLQKPSKDE